MNSQKNKKPLVDGKTYYLPIIFAASIDSPIEGGGYFISPGGGYFLLTKEAVQALREEVSTSKRCKDCAHAQPSRLYASNVCCAYQYPGCSWNKMCKACKHYEPRKQQSNGNA